MSGVEWRNRERVTGVRGEGGGGIVGSFDVVRPRPRLQLLLLHGGGQYERLVGWRGLAAMPGDGAFGVADRVREV